MNKEQIIDFLDHIEKAHGHSLTVGEKKQLALAREEALKGGTSKTTLQSLLSLVKGWVIVDKAKDAIIEILKLLDDT